MTGIARVATFLVLLCSHGQLVRAEDEESAGAATEVNLQMPGVKLNLEERSIDVDCELCLDAGTLELIACTKDSKEHESIVAINAKAIHIHTALLLLGAKSGNPAMRKQVGDGEEERWVEVPPKGGPVKISLVIADKDGRPIERPISDFIVAAESVDAGEKSKRKKFPTHTFLFAGSHVVTAGAGPRTYLADRSGNVISIATFGDEMLCLPGVHSHSKGELLWEIDSKHLPPVGSKVTLRLRPETKKSSREEQKKNPADEE